MARTRGRRPASPPEPTSEPRAATGPTDPGGHANGSARAAAGSGGRPPAAGGVPSALPRAAARTPSLPGAPGGAGAAGEAGSPGSPGGAGAPGAASPAAPSSGRPPGGPGASPRPDARPASGAGEPSAKSHPPRHAPPPPAGSRRSFRNGLIGGLIGGLLGGVAAWAALTYLVPSNASDEVQALRARVEQLGSAVDRSQGDQQALAELSSRVQALQQASPAAGGDLAARVEALEKARAAGSDQTQGGPGLAALTKRLDALEHGAGAAEGSAPTAGLDDLRTRLTALEGQVSSLATDVAGAGDARTGDVASLEALQSRLGAIESRLPEADAAAHRIDALSARVDSLEPTGAKVGQLAGDVDQIKQQSAAAQSRLDGLAAQVQGLGQQLQALGGDVKGVQTGLAETRNRAATADDRRAQAAALALITTQIDAALGQGKPYEAPLRSLTALGDQDAAVRQAATELAPGAASGVPSLAALRQSFAPVADEIVQRERAPEGGSLIDRATSNLMRLVTVRPVGADVAGEDAAARVARAEADLDRGDLAAAVAEVEALKGPAAEAAAAWLGDAKARLQATAALASLRAHVTALLSPTD